MTNARSLYGKPWSEREYIIVLHHYLLHRDEPKHTNAPFVKEVVAMRMENYTSIDPEMSEARAGLTNINRLGKRLFNKWVSAPESLRDCADLLMREAKGKRQGDLFDPSPVQIPKVFGHYEIADLIGEGGFGVVYSCIEIETNKLFALKIVRADKLFDSEALSRFRREIKILKTIDHPNVVKIREDNLDSERNLPAFVMKLATCSLAEYIQNKRVESGRGNFPILDRPEAVHIVQSVLDGLNALHRNEPPVLHRDVNPSNILLADDEWVLADFGLAKFASAAPATSTFFTTTRHGVGTQNYAAPEQYFNFTETGFATDVFSIGMLMWELFTDLGPPMDRRDLGLGEKMNAVVDKATHRDANLRYQSMREMREAFLSALE